MKRPLLLSPLGRTALLAALTALTALTLTAVPSAAQRVSQERGTDYSGDDYRDFRTRSADECQDACRDDRRCRAYAFNVRTSICYLKDEVGSFRRNADTVAGIKSDIGAPGTPGTPEGPGRPDRPDGDDDGRLTEERGLDYRGNDYSDFRARSAGDCKAECRRDRRCRAYAYNLNTDTCYLKDRAENLQRNPEVVGGARQDGGPGRPPGWGDGSLSEERGYDYRGNDYTDFRTRGVGDCKAECRRDRRCRAYAYNLRTDTCYLKDRAENLQRNADIVGGMKAGGGDGPPGRPGDGPGGGGWGNFKEYDGFDPRGHDIADFRTRGPEACQDECRRDRRCEAYAYNVRSGICYLKEDAGVLQRNDDVRSGVRQRN